MTLQEFTERTGIYPDDVLFEAILKHCVYAVHGGKDGFCKAYKKNTGGLAETIQCEANAAIRKMRDEHAAGLLQLTSELDEMQRELDDAREALDRELEWRPCYGLGTNMSQGDYDELFKRFISISEEEARTIVAGEFGFLPDRIEIADTVHDYEMNRHGELREAAEYQRQSLYGSGNRNYIRFNVRGDETVRGYEMIDGELEKYRCRIGGQTQEKEGE